MILQRTHWRWGRGRSLAALTLLLGLLGSPDIMGKESSARDGVLAEVLGEGRIAALLQEATTGSQSGARAMMAKKELLSLTPEKVVELALGNNLSLVQQRHQVDSARHGVDAADAAFMPVLNLSVTYRKSRSFERKESIGRLREVPQVWFEVYVDENGQPLADQEAAAQAAQQAEEQGQQGPDTIWAYGEQGGSYTTPGYSGSDECITVDGVTVNSDMDGNGSCGQTLAYSVEDEYASFKAEEWSNTWSGMARVSKIFFWGGSVNAQVATTRFPPYKPSKSATVGALEVAQNLGKVEWASSATLGMRTPVPFGKNFGSEGNFSAVQTNLSRLTMQRTELNQEATTNTVVRNALQAYWELVRALMQVEVSHKYRQTLVKNLARVQRLYDAGQATEYALLQARANLENSHNQEEIAWSTVVTRENNLSDLLNLPTKVVVVPEGFEKGLLEKSKVDANALLDKAMRERAEILVAKSDLDYQNLLLAYRKNQLLPDITLNATLGVGQSSSVFAYSSMSDSWSKLTDPDSMNYYVGFTWTVPWGDNKVRSEYTQARASHTQAMDREQQSLVRVAKEANGAIASFQSSQGREQLAKVNLNLANSALASAERQSELEMVTDFELLQRHQEVFKAQVEYVNSLLDQRVAQVSLQAASGELGRSGGSKPVGERP